MGVDHRIAPLGRTLAFYYAHVFFYDFIFGYAIFPAYFQLKGASPEMIGALLAVWAACIILFEVPAGLLADIADRRVLLCLAPLVKAVCFVIWVFADGQAIFYFVGIAFWSLASALRSGTKEALLYEHIVVSDQIHRYTSILGRERAFQESATLAGAALGGLIASHNLELAFWVSIVPLVLCAVAAGFVADIRSVRVTSADFSPMRTAGLLKSTLSEYLSKPEVRYVTLYVALCVTFLGTLEDFNQLFLLAIGMPVWSIGLIIAGIGIARLTLAYHASLFERFPATGWLSPFICGGALLITGFLPPVYALAAMVSAFVLVAPLVVLTMSRFQKTLDSASRATTTSVMSAFMEGLSVVFNLGIAFLFSQLSVVKAYQAGGVYLLLFAVWEFSRRGRIRRVQAVSEQTKKFHRTVVVPGDRVS